MLQLSGFHIYTTQGTGLEILLRPTLAGCCSNLVRNHLSCMRLYYLSQLINFCCFVSLLGGVYFQGNFYKVRHRLTHVRLTPHGSRCLLLITLNLLHPCACQECMPWWMGGGKLWSDFANFHTNQKDPHNRSATYPVAR